MSSAEKLFDLLPSNDGYPRLLGVPMTLVEQLRALSRSALDGEITLPAWRERHEQLLEQARPELEPGDLKRVEAQVSIVAAAVTEDFDRFLFLSGLGRNLRLLQAPDPERELRDLQEALPTLIGETSRASVERQLGVLRAMSTEPEAEVYEPGRRMFKALQVGTLEETYRWLQEAVAENPGASVQDLLTRAAIEVAEAKMELDRYDDLNGRPDGRRAR